MGYQTWFTGGLEFDKPVSEKLKNYINDFSRVRHMKRDNEMIKTIYPDWEEKCFNGNLGEEGEFFIGGAGFMGQDEDKSIILYNTPSKTQPGLWCQWIIEENELVWDQGEKFYDYVEWLKYLIDKFIAPSGYKLNGEIEFQGEDADDFGTIRVNNNVVEVSYGFRAMDLSEINTKDLIAELANRGYTVQN